MRELARRVMRRTAFLGAAVAMLLGAAAGEATAEERPSAHAAAACDDPRVSIDPTLPPTWHRAAVAACSALRDVPDTDANIHLQVSRTPHGARVDATLADGRHAERQVAAPGDLRIILEALAVRPPPPQPQPSSPKPPDVPPKVVPPAGAHGFFGQLAVLVSGRVATTPTYLSVGPTLTADVAFGPWFLGLFGRWEAYQAPAFRTAPNFQMMTAGGGVFAGRQVWEHASVKLETGIQIAVLAQTQSFVIRQEAEEEGNGTSSRGGSAADARLGVFVRSTVGSQSVRWLVLLDLEISPWQIGGSVRVDETGPPLPGFSIGIGTGISFGTLLSRSTL